MNPSPQHVRTRGPARPRNLAAGCLSVAVVVALLMLCGWFARRSGPDMPRDAEAEVVEAVPVVPAAP